MSGLTATLRVGVVLPFALAWPLAAIGATNEAVDAGGGSVTLLASGRVTVESTQLALVKQARDPAGVVLPPGADVSAGQELSFVLFVDNSTAHPARDLRLSDLLDETQFIYVPDSIETTVVASRSGDVAIWNGVWTPLTDPLGAPDDLASITDTNADGNGDHLTAGAVPGQVNQTLDVPGGSLRAVRFKVRVR